MRVQGSTVLSGCQLGQQRIYVGAKGRQLVVQQDRPAGIERVGHGFVVIGSSNAFPVPPVFRSVPGILWQGGDASELAALKITVEDERLGPGFVADAQPANVVRRFARQQRRYRFDVSLLLFLLNALKKAVSLLMAS